MKVMTPYHTINDCFATAQLNNNIICKHSPQPGLSVRVLAFGGFVGPAIPSPNQPQHLQPETREYFRQFF
ncbi:MAG: hypothetical protein MJE68_06975 [Proteobacteria bacterium]|nr:hypothetical protein [Pseudomonadota bacterium]